MLLLEFLNMDVLNLQVRVCSSCKKIIVFHASVTGGQRIDLSDRAAFQNNRLDATRNGTFKSTCPTLTTSMKCSFALSALTYVSI